MKPNEAFNNKKEEANDLKAKINNLINKFAQISVPPYNQQREEQIQSGQFQSKKLPNPKTKYYRTKKNQIYNQDNQISYYNSSNPNIVPNLNILKDQS